MPLSSSLTKSDVDFPEYRIVRVVELDAELKEVVTWRAVIGYKVQTAEGEEYTKDVQVDLAGATETTASGLYDTLKGELQALEGIS